jgi:cytochrome c oxidase subunit IV
VSDASHGENPYRIYWVSWFILLLITVAMLGAEAVGLPRWFAVPFLLAFMMVKAVMISGNFMHLRFEHRRMWWMVGVGLIATSLILFVFLVPETYNVSTRSAP